MSKPSDSVIVKKSSRSHRIWQGFADVGSGILRFLRKDPLALLLLAASIGLAITFFSLLNSIKPESPGRGVALTTIQRLSDAEQIKQAVLLDHDDRVVVRTRPGDLLWAAYPASGSETSQLIRTLDRNGAQIAVDQQAFKGTRQIIVQFLIPILLLVSLFGLFMRLSADDGSGGIASFSKFTGFGRKRGKDKGSGVTFADIAGVPDAIAELKEIRDYLADPTKYTDLGAGAPKGVLLVGPPGTGKTLLARAVAGEADAAFFSTSGSQFVESLVGVGAARVRDLFARARKQAPAIIFIDELDAAGRKRGAGVGQGNDEREQTLNQILVEMDGFDPTEKVIVMAATNRPDVLDPALLRPGRFDRRVTIDLPDRKDRLEILSVHARKKPFGPDVALDVIAERTPGFSGAELYSLMNEGAILAARENRKEITQYDLIRSIEKVMLGPERKSHLLGKKEKKLTAYHEAGHALVGSVLEHSDPIHKISIISRGRAAGYTLKLPFDDKRMQSKKTFLDDIATTLGGFAAEQMIYGDLTTGPSNDLAVVAALARDMVSRYGMSETLGPVAFAGDRAYGGTTYSQEVAAKIDAEVSSIIDVAKDRARQVLEENRKALDAIANRLVEVETLEREEFENILIANGITPKKKEEEETSLV
ncbi:MAG: ATP-dependent zinc metalloprotease FtsH [Solirubrobacteraceae bacterium]